MILAPFNSVRFNTTGWNGQTRGTAITETLKVIYNQRDIFLDWVSVPGTLFYRVQVSLFPDFRTVFEDEFLSASEYGFTDNEVSGRRRYWRWRPSLDGITFFEPWSEVGSYWLDTALADEVSLIRNQWAIANPADMLDQYRFTKFPQYTILKRNLMRAIGRNRLGELLSEFLTVKDAITLRFEGAQYLAAPQFNEILRYYNTIRTFFLVAFKDGERQRPMPHVWEVELLQDPEFTMIAAGRQDLLTGTLTFEEV